MNSKVKVLLIVYGSLLSSIIAFIAFIFLMSEKALTHLLWHSLPEHVTRMPLYSFAIIVLCFGIVFLLKKHWGNLPKTSHDVVAELQDSQTVNYVKMYRSLLVALVILVAGAGVGPEAPLLGAVIAYSIWQADKMRFVAIHWREYVHTPWRQRLVMLFHPYQYGVTFDKENLLIAPRLKKVVVSLLVLNGLIVFLILMNNSDQSGFITHLGQSRWQLKDSWLVIPLSFYGLIIGKGYQLLKQRVEKLWHSWSAPLSVQLGIGAISIFSVVIFAPVLLFSGQHSMETLITMSQSTPAFVLLVLSFVKLLFLDICLWSGWVGGDIFPITFAAIMQGFAVAALLPTVDSLFVVLVVAISLAMSLLHNYWVAAIFITLFFPINLWVVSIVTVMLYVGVDYVLKTLKGVINEKI